MCHRCITLSCCSYESWKVCCSHMSRKVSYCNAYTYEMCHNVIFTEVIECITVSWCSHGSEDVSQRHGSHICHWFYHSVMLLTRQGMCHSVTLLKWHTECVKVSCCSHVSVVVSKCNAVHTCHGMCHNVVLAKAVTECVTVSRFSNKSRYMSQYHAAHKGDGMWHSVMLPHVSVVLLTCVMGCVTVKCFFYVSWDVLLSCCARVTRSEL